MDNIRGAALRIMAERTNNSIQYLAPSLIRGGKEKGGKLY